MTEETVDEQLAALFPTTPTYSNLTLSDEELDAARRQGLGFEEAKAAKAAALASHHGLSVAEIEYIARDKPADLEAALREYRAMGQATNIDEFKVAQRKLAEHEAAAVEASRQKAIESERRKLG